MKYALFSIMVWFFGSGYAQSEKFLGAWVSTTQLMSGVEQIPNFRIIISKDSQYLYLDYCYITPDEQKTDCSSEHKYAGKIPISEIHKRSFEIDIKSSKNEEGRLRVTQHKEYLYWKLLECPQGSDFLPENEIFVKD